MRSAFPRFGRRRPILRRAGMGTLGIDILADLNSVITSAENEVVNALPTWAGGSPLNASELADIQSKAAAQIDAMPGIDPQVAAKAKTQLYAETNAVAQQAYQQAWATDIYGVPSPGSTISSVLLWVAVGLGVVVLIYEVV